MFYKNRWINNEVPFGDLREKMRKLSKGGSKCVVKSQCFWVKVHLILVICRGTFVVRFFSAGQWLVHSEGILSYIAYGLSTGTNLDDLE